jgi:hypothetical protein
VPTIVPTGVACVGNRAASRAGIRAAPRARKRPGRPALPESSTEAGELESGAPVASRSTDTGRGWHVGRRVARSARGTISTGGTTVCTATSVSTRRRAVGGKRRSRSSTPPRWSLRRSKNLRISRSCRSTCATRSLSSTSEHLELVP